MNKMKSLSYLALTLMLTGVLAACGSDEANSPAPASQSESDATTLPPEETKTKEDNSNHPTNETDIDLDEDAPAAGTTDNGDTPESKDSQKLPDAKDSSITIDEGATTQGNTTETPVPSDDDKDKDSSAAATTPSKDSSAETKPAETKPADTAAAAQTAAGEYVGLADGHTAEIEVKGEAVAYQLSEEAQAQIGKIPADAKVTFTYTEEQFDAETKILTITDIKAAE